MFLIILPPPLLLHSAQTTNKIRIITFTQYFFIVLQSTKTYFTILISLGTNNYLCLHAEVKEQFQLNLVVILLPFTEEY